MKKRIVSLFFTGVMAIALFYGCDTGTAEPGQSSIIPPIQTNRPAQNTDAPGKEDETGKNETLKGKTLVVYYSATGTTERVANMIAEATGGELLKLEPVTPYTADDLDYQDSNSRVSKEHANEAERNVELISTTANHFQEVSVVYIGYPVWWGIAAWPVNSFIKNNDFSGKTVIPFCTSASSGIGDSGKRLSEMSGTGNWLEGKRFGSGTSAGEVKAWVESLVLQ